MLTDFLTEFDDLTVNFDVTFTLKHGKGVESEGLHLVFAREGIDGCEEANATTQFVDDILRMGHAAREQNGINLATEHSGLGSNILGNVVEHCIDDELGVLVTVLDALLYLAHVVGAQMGIESCLASNAFQ